MRLWLRISCALATLALLSGCFHARAHHRGHAQHAHRSAVVVRAPGPPPNTPGHGYRHKLAHHGLELVFDSALGVYTVVGWRDHFYYDGYFYRQVASGWEVSLRVQNGWAAAVPRRLPRRLALREHRHHHKKHKHYPAKHRH